jgi:hypothetical protein
VLWRNLCIYYCYHLGLFSLDFFHDLFQKYKILKSTRNILGVEIDHTVSMVVFWKISRATKCMSTFYSIPLIRLLGLRFLLRLIKKKVFFFRSRGNMWGDNCPAKSDMKQRFSINGQVTSVGILCVRRNMFCWGKTAKNNNNNKKICGVNFDLSSSLKFGFGG